MQGGRPYRGYPYVDAQVTDVPSIDSATAAKWNHLPRKQIQLPVTRKDPVIYNHTPDGHVDAETHNNSLIARDDRPHKLNPDLADPGPEVYIDLPETSGSYVTTGGWDPSHEVSPASSSVREHKRDPGDDPVVYIDLPDGNGSDVAQSSRVDEPEFVQNTIYFDPFENRRIEMHKEERADSESEEEQTSPPMRSTTPALYGPGAGPSTSRLELPSPAGLSSYMSKETMMYQAPEERFPSPIPVSEFPEPPPSYAEIDSTSSPVVDIPPELTPESREEFPRTQVILPGDYTSPGMPIGVPNPDRKYLNCHHCSTRVHTLVVKENGTITHAMALMCLVILFIPVVICIYATDNFKITNHYCPNCNKIIGYQLPFGSQKIIYVY